MSKLNSFIINTELVKEDRKFKRTTKSYTQLLNDYSTFERELEALDILQYKWEATLDREKYDDDNLYDKITLEMERMNNKLIESSKICDYIYNSPIKEQCYILFKEKFDKDKDKNYNLPEINEHFLNYIIDYKARVTDLVVRRVDSIRNTDISTLMGFDIEQTPGYQ